MTLIEIENLDLAGMTALWKTPEKRAVAIVELAQAPAAELATRYLQARFDATTRDAKLAQQGPRIENLETLSETMLAKLNSAGQELETVKRELLEQTDLKTRAVQHAATLQAQRDAARALARDRRMQLVRVMQHAHQLMDVVAPLLAAEEPSE